MSVYTLADVSMSGCIKDNGKQQYQLCFEGWNGKRTYSDFLKLSNKRKRQLNKKHEQLEEVGTLHCKDDHIQGLPKKSLNLISNAAPWEKNGSNWPVTLTSSVKKVEQWLLDGLNCNEEVISQDTLYFLSSRFDEDAESSISKGDQQLNSRDMQQYFCVEANLNALVTAALHIDNSLADVESFESTCGHSKGTTEPTTPTMRTRKFVLVEPSCGDGRILQHILDRKCERVASIVDGEEDEGTGSHTNRCNCIVAAVGIDLDQSTASEAHKKLSTIRQFREGYERFDIPVICRDFLDITVGDLMTWLYPNKLNHDGMILSWSPSFTSMTSSTPTQAKQSDHYDGQLEVLVVGSPPFTDYSITSDSSISKGSIRGSEIITKRAKLASQANSGGGTDESCEFQEGFRSLPFKFILKAAKPVSQGGLGASKVAYLLPQRCSKPNFITAVREELERCWAIPTIPAATQPSVSTTEETGECQLGQQCGLCGRRRDVIKWDIAVTPSPDKHFLFRGRLVPQPSVVFVLNRKVRVCCGM